jgi:2-polyprenyl-3-methyl-5-hydroxy-6-metoxy-1,4-benzoquinol methylase
MNEARAADYIPDNNRYYREVIENKLAPAYLQPWPNPDESARVAEILKFVSCARQDFGGRSGSFRCLDLGCGRGWLTAMLSHYGICEGLDPSPDWISLAKTYHPELTFICSTLSEAKAIEKYDLVVSSEVIEHVPWRLKGAFAREILAALRPRGYCIVTSPRGELFRHYRRLQPQLQAIENWLTERQMKKVFLRNGFEVVDHARAYPTVLGIRGRILRRIGSLLGRLGLRSVRSWSEYRRSIYQVWLFRRST